MASQFAKRMAKAKEKDVNEEKDLTNEVKDDKIIVYGNYALDVITRENKHVIVVVDYNVETGEAAVREVKPVSRDVALVFKNKKSALKTLANIKD